MLIQVIFVKKTKKHYNMKNVIHCNLHDRAYPHHGTSLFFILFVLFLLAFMSCFRWNPLNKWWLLWTQLSKTLTTFNFPPSFFLVLTFFSLKKLYLIYKSKTMEQDRKLVRTSWLELDPIPKKGKMLKSFSVLFLSSLLTIWHCTPDIKPRKGTIYLGKMKYIPINCFLFNILFRIKISPGGY